MIRSCVSGQRIGDYTVEAELGGGLSCYVYRGAHIAAPDRPVVIKILNVVDQQDYERFLQEAHFLELLRHPYVLPLLAVGICEDVPYIITDYASHGSLRERIERYAPYPMPLSEVISILSQVGQALSHVHQHNVIHGDLKPDNILFNADGEAILADFGLSSILAHDGVEEQVGTYGSIPYMAPERLAGLISKASDQYALGCIAFELVTGRTPFFTAKQHGMQSQFMLEEPPIPTQLNPLLPQEMEQIIHTTIAEQPSDRYKDIDTFLTALQTVPATLSDDTKTAVQWVYEGLMHVHFQRYDQAFAAYEYAQRLEPDDSYVYECKAEALYALQHYEDALAACEQAIMLDAEDVDAYHCKGRILSELARYDEALAAFEQALTLNPGDMDASTGKALVL